MSKHHSARPYRTASRAHELSSNVAIAGRSRTLYRCFQSDLLASFVWILSIASSTLSRDEKDMIQGFTKQHRSENVLVCASAQQKARLDLGADIFWIF